MRKDSFARILSDMDTEARLRLTDPRQMRALAHPLRLKLLGLLRSDGPATATMLAEQVGESAALVSFHARSLAAHGFVREAPELARDGRERWWRAAHPSMSWNPAEFLDSPEGFAAADALQSQIAHAHAEVADAWLAEVPTWSPDWVDAADLSDWRLTLNTDQVRALRDELAAIVERFAAMPPGDGAASVSAIIHLIPRHGREEG